MSPVCETNTTKRCNKLASVLAIGTANPPNVVYQAGFADLYFRVTDSDHMTDLKAKIKRICMFLSFISPYIYYRTSFVCSTNFFTFTHLSMFIFDICTPYFIAYYRFDHMMKKLMKMTDFSGLSC